MTSGVYLIVNNRTGQKYVGGSIDIERRMKEHVNKPKKNSYIDNAIQKHGFDDFNWQVIEELPADWDIIGDREKYWIKFYNTFKDSDHYNLTSGGERNFEVSEKTRKKMSENHTDCSGENGSFYNKKHTLETRKKISEALTGRVFTEEHKQKLVENHADFSGENHPQWGTKHSEEYKKKLSEKNSQRQTTTGYYRVWKKTRNSCKQGFTYQYGYRDINGKRRVISSVSLEKLEKKVKNAGLPWKILDEEKALKTLNEVSS